MSLRPDVDQGSALQASTWSLTAVAFVFLVLRFWARLSKYAVGIDDAFMLLSWLLFLVSTIIFNFVATTGGTRHMEYLTLAEIQYQLKLTIINLPFAISVTALGKIAIGVTILRIVGNTSRGKKWSVWAMLMLLITASIVDIFLGLFQCGDPRNQWDLTRMATAKCLPSYVFNNFNYFTIAVQVFSDYFFSVLPMVVVWKLNMKMRRKLTIMVLLSLTLVTGAVGTVKLVNQTRLSTADLTGGVYKVALLFSLEAMFIIVFGSLPVLNPLWESCVEIRQSIKSSGLTGSTKVFSLGSSNKQNTGQGSHAGTAPHDSKWIPDGNTELASLTGYSERPAVFVHGGEQFTGYPQQPVVFIHGGEQFTGYPQQPAVFVNGGGQFIGYPQQSAVFVHSGADLTAYPQQVVFHGGGELPGYPQQSAASGHHGEEFQDERWSNNQTPGAIHVQHQVYQNITPQQNTHGTHGY